MHIREIYSYRRCLIKSIFLIHPEPYSPNGNRHLDHNASTDADVLKEVPFKCVEICNDNFRGHICPPPKKKNEKSFNHC
jgi:hypothetical protein